jgi:hypothetical protein
MNTERIRRAANMGFIMLTEGVNFDAAIYTACARHWIELDSEAFLAVRYRMARDLYEW